MNLQDQHNPNNNPSAKSKHKEINQAHSRESFGQSSQQRNKNSKAVVNTPSIEKKYSAQSEGANTTSLVPLEEILILQGAPYLNDKSDTLYNEACRISAIQTFRQIAISGAYEYLNVNFQHLEQVELLTKVYNHYVHWYVAQQYKKEIKEPGKYAKGQERKEVLQYRLRLKDVCYKFGVAQGFPNQYLKILAEPDAHSDDEYDLINASKSLLGKPHPDERLSNKRFTDKYWAEAIQEYDILHEIFNDNELDDSLSQESDDLEYLAEVNDY
ncbi:hypothetical protein O181_075140 [Austropuccinia psidii MF-1]|uniref:Uncharacterized protein n=1 Tax=Austropuccinia psidii MF-1 TaxID=1389203 RepID=A0A9Q3F606_9BASI|nr:hypothetical protein [Austropuccinia psidii MF-1]